MYIFHPKCLMKCLNEFFIDCLIFYGVDLNNGQFVQSSSTFQQWKPSFFKVRVDVTLKDLKDKLNKINQGVIPEDARRVEDIWYAHPGYL